MPTILLMENNIISFVAPLLVKLFHGFVINRLSKCIQIQSISRHLLFLVVVENSLQKTISDIAAQNFLIRTGIVVESSSLFLKVK